MPRAARPASTSPRTDATRGDPRQKEKLLETITETEVPNLKHVWQKSRTIIPPTGVVHGHRYIAQLWNKTHREKPASWANYWDPGPAYGDKIKGHLIAFEPANLLSVYALIMAAKLKGGGVDNIDPAWELLRTQKPWVGVSVMASDAAAPYFENDQVWLAPFWSAAGQRDGPAAAHQRTRQPAAPTMTSRLPWTTLMSDRLPLCWRSLRRFRRHRQRAVSAPRGVSAAAEQLAQLVALLLVQFDPPAYVHRRPLHAEDADKNPMLGDSRPSFTARQGQYLAFIHAYTLVIGHRPRATCSGSSRSADRPCTRWWSGWKRPAWSAVSRAYHAASNCIFPDPPCLSYSQATINRSEPLCRGTRRNRELWITGVLPGNRSITVEIALTRVGDPASAITIGACAIDSRHRTPTFPDTELRFDVEAALRRLGTSSVTAAVLPLTLGPGEYQPPAFVYSSIAITAAPT